MEIGEKTPQILKALHDKINHPKYTFEKKNTHAHTPSTVNIKNQQKTF